MGNEDPQQRGYTAICYTVGGGESVGWRNWDEKGWKTMSVDGHERKKIIINSSLML